MQPHKGTVSNYIRKAFAESGHWWVTNGNPSPSDRVVTTFIIVQEVSGFSCTDRRLIAGSPEWPTTLPVGFQFNGNYTDITITSGAIFCVFNIE